MSLQHASEQLKGDEEVVLTAISIWDGAWQYASEDLKNNKDFVFMAYRRRWWFRVYVTPHISTLKELMLLVASRDGAHLKYFSDKFKDDKDTVLKAVKKDGAALLYASEQLRAEKEVVLAASKRLPAALKYSKGGLNQDHDLLKACGLWDQKEVIYERKEQAILSVKFSMAERSTPFATEFALQMKNHGYLRKFRTYNPNAWCKKSCDPVYTNIEHPCRGTPATCQIPEHDNFGADGKPTSKCCWRSSFRFQLEECKSTNGFMIQRTYNIACHVTFKA